MNPEQALRRKKMLAAIHIAKVDVLGGDDDAYRGLIRRISDNRTDTAASLSMVELSRVMDDLKRIGWRPGKKKDAQRRALVIEAKRRASGSLGPAWRVRLDGMARHVAGVDRIEWVRSSGDLERILAIIKNCKE